MRAGEIGLLCQRQANADKRIPSTLWLMVVDDELHGFVITERILDAVDFVPTLQAYCGGSKSLEQSGLLAVVYWSKGSAADRGLLVFRNPAINPKRGIGNNRKLGKEAQADSSPTVSLPLESVPMTQSDLEPSASLNDSAVPNYADRRIARSDDFFWKAATASGKETNECARA